MTPAKRLRVLALINLRGRTRKIQLILFYALFPGRGERESGREREWEEGKGKQIGPTKEQNEGSREKREGDGEI